MDNQAQLLTEKAVNDELAPQEFIQLDMLPQIGLKNVDALVNSLNTFSKVRIQHHSNYYATNIHPLNRQYQIPLSDFANQIASAILASHHDYASKLDLIQAAIHHPIFKRSTSIKRQLYAIFIYLQNLLHDIFNISHYPKEPLLTDAQLILDKAKQYLVNSRDKIILS